MIFKLVWVFWASGFLRDRDVGGFHHDVFMTGKGFMPPSRASRLGVLSRMITFPLGDLPCSWQNRC